MRLLSTLVVAFALFGAIEAAPPKPARSAHRVPNGWFAFGYRQMENGVVGDVVFLGKLSCAGGQCQMSTASFFPCVSDAGTAQSARNVFLDHGSTGGAGLTVVAGPVDSRQRQTITIEEVVHGATIRYIFDVLLDGGGAIKYLMGFSGAATKPRALTGSPAAWTLRYLSPDETTLNACRIILNLEQLTH